MIQFILSKSTNRHYLTEMYSAPKLIFSRLFKGDCSARNKKKLLYILDKNDINKTCRSCFATMFLFVKIFCQP